jgi:branched-subunit amino acid ABC-type transport system permease component
MARSTCWAPSWPTAASSLAPHIGFWPALLLAPLACGLLGALVEMLLLRRIYKAPELFQLLATFALVLVIKDAALWLWGPEELFGPRAAGWKARSKSWAASSRLRSVADRRRPACCWA